MDKIFLIIKYGFDPSENYRPDYTEIVGFAESEELAKSKADELQAKSKKYQGGWDRRTYPYFTIREIEHINKWKEEKPILRLWS